MARGTGKIYDSADALVAGVAKETGLAETDVRKVLRASFESTKDYVLRELGQVTGGRSELSDSDLEGVVAGASLSRSTLDTASLTTLGKVSLSTLSTNDLRQKLIGSIHA